jgi:hypothetical protein
MSTCIRQLGVGAIILVAGQIRAAQTATPSAAPAAAAPAATYTLSEINRYTYFFQSGRLIKLDTLVGDFTVLNFNDGVWNPVVIPTRDPRGGDENGRNIGFLVQNLTNENLRRLSDPTRLPTRFRFISVYFNPDGRPIPTPSDPPQNAIGTGVSNPNYLNRLVRLDTVTGEFALMDVESASFVRVKIPTQAASPDANSDNVRLISGLHL